MPFDILLNSFCLLEVGQPSKADYIPKENDTARVVEFVLEPEVEPAFLGREMFPVLPLKPTPSLSLSGRWYGGEKRGLSSSD